MSNTAVIGEPFTLLIQSPDTGENSIVNIRDFKNQLILQTNATRDIGSNNIYSVTFTLDESVPVPLDETNDQYIAELLNSTGNVIATKTFNVISRAEPIAHSNDVLAVLGSPIQDQIFTTAPASDSRVDISIMKGNNPIINLAVKGDTIPYGKFYITKYSIMPVNYNNVITSSGEYMLVVNYNNATEYHPLHVIDVAGIQVVHEMRMDLDKARLIDIDPTLNFSDSDLYHYLMMGITRFNMLGRLVTYWNLPVITSINFGWAIEKLGVIEALEAWSLAEGMKAFQFTGASIQLTVNRKQAIDDMLSNLKAKIPEMTAAKDAFIQQNLPQAYAMGQLSSVSSGVYGPTCPPAITTKLYTGTLGYGL